MDIDAEQRSSVAAKSDSSQPTTGFRRAVLKLSGESFVPTGERGIEMREVLHIATQI